MSGFNAFQEMLSGKLPKLKPLPSREWSQEFKELTEADAWLRRKLDRNRRMRDHLQYVLRNIPELLHIEHQGLFIDLGPGPGELLEIADAMGFRTMGYEAVSGEGGMGQKYFRVSQLMHQRQHIKVLYGGLEAFVGDYDETRCDRIKRPASIDSLIGDTEDDDGPEAVEVAAVEEDETIEDAEPAKSDKKEKEHPYESESRHGSASLINSRGSIEQMFSNLMDGVPHHMHHDCRQLQWRVMNSTIDAFVCFLTACREVLRTGGILLIQANGSANDEWYGKSIIKAAKEVDSLRLVHRGGNLLHKWIKV